MKSKEQIKSMLFSRLTELEDGRIKTLSPKIAQYRSIELALLYDILEDDVDDEYWDRIEHQIL